MFQTDVEYYRRRATQERKMALKAERQDVAAIHEELARQYDALATEPQLRPRLHITTRQASA